MADPTLPSDEAAEKKRAADRARARRYYEKNREKVLARQKELVRRLLAADPDYWRRKKPADPERRRAWGRRSYEKNKEKILARQKERVRRLVAEDPDYFRRKRSADPGRYRAYERRWREKDPEKARTIGRNANRRWRAANPEKVKADFLRRYWADPERYRAYAIKAHKADPDRRRTNRANYRARVERQMPPWVLTEEIYLIYKNCPADMHVDHIVPLLGRTAEDHPISGLHVPWNLQYLTVRENHSKSNRMRPEDHTAAEAPVNSGPRQLSFFDD